MLLYLLWSWRYWDHEKTPGSHALGRLHANINCADNYRCFRVVQTVRVETIGDATLYLGDCLEILPTLDNVDANVIGVILNNVKPEVGPDYFKYHTYYYYGPDKKPEEKGDSGQAAS